MSGFQAFFETGIEHILALAGLDHMLFIASILFALSWRQWRQALLMLTAFTLGHAASMLISYTELSPLPTPVVEFLIPITIFTTAVWQLLGKGEGKRRQYLLVLLFGMVHGLAYAGEFMHMMGRSAEVLMPLLGFNLGVECAQLLVAALILSLSTMLQTYAAPWWSTIKRIIFGGIAAYAAYLAIQNWPW